MLIVYIYPLSVVPCQEKEYPMSIEKNRRTCILTEIKRFFDTHKGFPSQWQKEIDELCPEDQKDALDVIIGLMCTPEWGGAAAASGFLSTIGVKDDEIEMLIAENLDFGF